MSDVRYLSLEQLIGIHYDQITRYSGSHGVRDLALLESALYRPQSTFADQELYPTLYDKAAALIHSLISNHPFLDGNKRTAVVAGILFLRMNGKKLQVDQSTLIQAALAIAAKEWDLPKIASWLELYCS